MARPKGTVERHDNIETLTILRQFSDVYDQESYDTFASGTWLDDILRGSTGQFSGTQRPSPYQMFSILSTMAEISTTGVGALLNMKQRMMDEKDYSKSYMSQWTKALKCASEAIVFHNERQEQC